MGVSYHFQQFFCYIIAVSFIDGRNRWWPFQPSLILFTTMVSLKKIKIWKKN